MTSELVYGVVLSGPQGDGTRVVDTDIGRFKAFVRGNSVDIGTPVLITRVQLKGPCSLWVIVEPDNMSDLDPRNCVECDKVLTVADAVDRKTLSMATIRCREHRLEHERRRRLERAAA